MKNKELILTFDFDKVKIRTITTSVDEIWFMLKDICKVLNIKNDTDVWNRLDEDERAEVDFTYPSSNGVTQTRKGHFINEPGLYTVILRSNSDKAKSFRRWVTHDVLPTIRKQGYYSLYSDEQTIELIVSRTKEQLRNNKETILDKINKSQIKASIKAEIREEKYQDIKKLWVEDFYTADTTEFFHKLKSICNGDGVLFHKYWDLYNKQKNPKFRGVIVI